MSAAMDGDTTKDSRRKLRLGVVFAFAAVLVLLLCALRPEQSGPVPSPLALAARTVHVNVKVLRWLWWPVIVYLFWGMAHVCDIYFVSAIDVITKRFKISEDVAGATLMALGCNGPEMSLNLIAIWQPSNIGVGAVIGGEVFNVLVIIGTALLATPDDYMPLQLGKFSFGRDVLFYCVSVALLYYALHDMQISQWDVAILLSGGAVYVLVVVYSTKLRRFFQGLLARRRLARDLSRKMSERRVGTGDSGVYSDNSDSDLSSSALFRMSPLLNPKTNEPDPIKVRYWNDASHCKDPSSGTVLKVRVDMHNRLMDRVHKSDDRYVVLMENALMVSTLIDPRTLGQSESRCASGMVYDRSKDKVGFGNGESSWHHGGLVNPPKTMSKHPSAKDSTHHTPTSAMSQSLLSGELDLPQMFKASPWEVIPLEDIIWMDRPVERKRFNLHVSAAGHDSELAQIMPIATLEFLATDEEIVESWTQALKVGLLAHRQGRGMGPPTQSASGLAIAWLEWLQFPIQSFTALSIPDVSREDLEDLYPIAFVMSMLWLAVFAYCVVAACDGIHQDFGISTSVLGYTIAAAGTSFPNVFSGMCVARQGKTTMAVANALGANVQNVFLALAIPWAVQCCINRGSFNMPFNGLAPAVVEIYVTLLPVVSVFIFCKFTFPRWSGYLFLMIYALYLAVALRQDVTHCPWWPFECPEA